MLLVPRMLGTQEKWLLHFFFAEGVTPPEVASPTCGRRVGHAKEIVFLKVPGLGTGLKWAALNPHKTPKWAFIVCNGLWEDVVGQSLIQ